MKQESESVETFKGIHIGVPSSSEVPVLLRPREVGGASGRWERVGG